MGEYTPNYGAITEIVDNTSTYTMTDKTGTEFTFEVVPLHITSDEISKLLDTIKDKQTWFISYNTSIVSPEQDEINKALNDGLIIKLSIRCSIIDNHGLIHNIEYNKQTNTYSIRLSNVLYNLGKSQDFLSLSDKLIDLVKESDNPRYIVSNLTSSSRAIFTKLLNEISVLTEKVRKLEQK